jgi:hypothetical protein
VVGYAIFAASAVMLFSAANRQPHEPAPIAFIIGSTLFGMLFAGIGGFLAAFIGGRRDTAIAITVLIAMGALISICGDTGSHWSPITALVFMSPMAALGGRLIKAQAPLFPSKKKVFGTHLVTVPEKGFRGAELQLDAGVVKLNGSVEYRGYEAPDSDVVALMFEGRDSSFRVVGNSVQANKRSEASIKRLDWIFEGVSFFDVGPRDSAKAESDDRVLDEFEVLEIDPQYRFRLRFHSGVIIEVAANSTHVVIIS